MGAGPGNKPTIDEVAQQRERDAKILELANSGLLGVQIAAELKIHKSTVTRSLQRIWARNEQPLVHEHRAQWNARIEAALHGIWPKVIKGDPVAVHAFCRLEEQAAKLNGLNQQGVVDAGALADALLQDPVERATRAKALRDQVAEGRRAADGR